MDEQSEQSAQTFPVVCVWCGSEIRQGTTPGCSGMCQPCFRQMVDEHTQLAARQQARLYASDR